MGADETLMGGHGRGRVGVVDEASDTGERIERVEVVPARPLALRAVPATAGAAVALWMGGQQSFTWQAYVGVAAVSLYFLGWAASHRTPRRPAPRRLHPLGIVAWSVPVLAFSALEIVDDVLGSTAAHPTLSSAMDPVLDHPLWRSLAFGIWMLAGRELVRR